MGLRRACNVLDAEQINALLSDTLRRIENEFDSEVLGRAIADAIMQRLHGGCDRVAAIRQFLPGFPWAFSFAEEVINLGVGILVGKTTTKRDDYTGLQNLTLFSVIECFHTGGDRSFPTPSPLCGKMTT